MNEFSTEKPKSWHCTLTSPRTPAASVCLKTFPIFKSSAAFQSDLSSKQCNLALHTPQNRQHKLKNIKSCISTPKFSVNVHSRRRFVINMAFFNAKRELTGADWLHLLLWQEKARQNLKFRNVKLEFMSRAGVDLPVRRWPHRCLAGRSTMAVLGSRKAKRPSAADSRGSMEDIAIGFRRRRGRAGRRSCPTRLGVLSICYLSS